MVEFKIKAPTNAPLPDTNIDPVNWCELPEFNPNMFEPLEYTILDVIVCTTNVCATIVPVAVRDPVMVWEPLNWFDPVVANDPVRAFIAATDDDVRANDDVVANEPVIDSFDVKRAANEPDATTNADDVDSLFVMREANEDESVDTVNILDISEPFSEIEPVNIGLCISIYYCFRINIILLLIVLFVVPNRKLFLLVFQCNLMINILLRFYILD